MWCVATVTEQVVAAFLRWKQIEEDTAGTGGAAPRMAVRSTLNGLVQQLEVCWRTGLVVVGTARVDGLCGTTGMRGA